jgi:hypothetical protein
MNDPERPPLDPRVFEQILKVQHAVDKVQWPRIAAFMVPVYTLPSNPVPPPTPLELTSAIQLYADMLFKAEADQYSSFRDEPRYPAWLSRLADRISVRVLESVEKIEKAEFFRTLYGHGVNQLQMQEAIRESLNTTVTRYQWQDVGPHPADTKPEEPQQMESVLAEQPQAPKTPPHSTQTQRVVLRDSYRALFPDVKIQDICWAAEQTYREWRRWINGEAKDGLKPDRAFRHVLTSNRKPEEIRRQPRPTKYNY